MEWSLLLLTLSCAVWLAGADLMDLYVQHMDETMGTRAYYDRLKASRRAHVNRQRRSVLEGRGFRVADQVSQRIDVNRVKVKYVPDSDLSLDYTHPQPQESYPDIEQSFDSDKKIDFSRFIDSVQKRERKKGRAPKKYIPEMRNLVFPLKRRPKRSSNERQLETEAKREFTRYERLDNEGNVVLEWDPTDDENVTFRVTAKTLGYIGLGFNDKSHMMGADIVLAWVDDHTRIATLLDSHGVESNNAAPETDASQDVHLLHGSQNDTHTVVTFTRRWQSCDPQDRSLTGDTVRVLWALHESDPELNAARFHGEKRGGRALRLKAPAPHPPPTIDDPSMIKWDVKLNQFSVPNNSDTTYWCKIFKAPKLQRKHHMIGYTPLVEEANEGLVHHVILYECASDPILAEHSRMHGAHCYSPTMPVQWASCLQPVLAWARGSRGEWFPEHVGLPVAENLEGSYYMLEVHYNNKFGREVIDSSGVRLHLTPKIRKMEAGIFVAGVAVSPLHMVPPQQKEYATAGYCTPDCTNKMFDKEGINVVSVVLHSHLAGRRLGLKHIRQGKELPPIVQDNHFDFEYQQSHTLEREVKILPGDELVAECVYDTRGRTKPTFGGYAASQEMCLAFVVHYPRTPLAACYSMTPVKEFFNALNVQSFKGMTMENAENLFLSTTTETVTLPVSPNHHTPNYPDIRSNDSSDIDFIKRMKSALISKGDYIDYDDIFGILVIEKPDEFAGHSLSDHMSALAWNDTALSKSIENSLYYGKHATYCRTREDRFPRTPKEHMFPNFTALPVSNDTSCKEVQAAYGSTASSTTGSILSTFLVLPLLLVSLS
ncbi:MOXD1 homolog 1 [Nasonia vitripennis]|uniref:DOMON domain-containing protein n=1 Tax=Nasonia vitripennis TaxID=7425 RepID=A0A7M7LUG1_NASVI|nr:MOXD1 homolog 1 [Nasonia vitripennis]